MGNILQEIANRINLLKQQLDIIEIYKEDFVEKVGESGRQAKIDEILDELKMLKEIRDLIKKKES